MTRMYFLAESRLPVCLLFLFIVKEYSGYSLTSRLIGDCSRNISCQGTYIEMHLASPSDVKPSLEPLTTLYTSFFDFGSDSKCLYEISSLCPALIPVFDSGPQ